MTQKTKKQAQQIREALKIESFNHLEENERLNAWSNWRDVLNGFIWGELAPEVAAAKIERARELLKTLNDSNRAEISALIEQAERENEQAKKKEEKRIANGLIFSNFKAEEMPHEIKRALINKKALFEECGMVANQPLCIKKLQSNKPAYLKQFDDTMRENQKEGGRWFYIILFDEELAKERRLWNMEKNIICDFEEGKACELMKEHFDSGCDRYGRRRADVRGFGHFWRKSDYEEARKCAKIIFCVYQPSGDIERIKELQKARKEAREELNEIGYYRHNISKAHFNEITREYREDKSGYYYYTVNRFDYFDVSGWNLSNKREELKQKARELKEKREKARLIETNGEQETKELEKMSAELIASLDSLVSMLKRYLITNKKLRLFWLQTRIERTTDAIANICELKKDFENKNEIFNSISQMMGRYNKRTTDARHTLQLNAIYLSMTEEEHADTESAKNNAIYYGYYNDIGGALVLDLEKAQAEKVKRGY